MGASDDASGGGGGGGDGGGGDGGGLSAHARHRSAPTHHRGLLTGPTGAGDAGGRREAGGA